MVNEVLLRAQNLELYSPARNLLQTLSFTLVQKEVLFLLGPNGSGKSTLLKYIFREYCDSEKDNFSVKKNLSLSYLPQSLNREFFIPMTLMDISELGCSGNQISDRNLCALLPSGGQRKLWNNSSGGERQRALLVQALSQDKDVYLLDEPFNHLDTQGIEDVAGAISSLARDRSKSFVIASHLVPLILEGGILSRLSFLHNREVNVHE